LDALILILGRERQINEHALATATLGAIDRNRKQVKEFLMVNRQLAHLLIPALIASGTTTTNAATNCEPLTSFKLSNTTITSAQTIAAGEFATTGLQVTLPTKNIPGFCRVTATLKAAKDSDIKMEVWLPIDGWNGRFQGVGNNGFAGSTMYSAMIQAVTAGYATASTDTGHSGSPLSASWALNHPDKIIDYSHRAVHMMTLVAQEVVNAYYEKPAHHSYWNGCSQGGAQGLAEAQRYPDDYDGIVVGAPANNMTHLRVSGNWIAQAIHKDPKTFIADSKLPAINQAVLAACDDIDGVQDGIIDDPRSCAFDIARLKCQGAENDSCLTIPQMMGLQKVYGGTRGSHASELVYPGYLVGSELQWVGQISGSESPPRSQQFLKQAEFFKYIVFSDAKWDWRSLDFNLDVDRVDKAVGNIVNHNDANLSAFKKRGGKLLQYHGWYDPAISPLDSIQYFDSVQLAMKNTRDFYRLYMIPGMAHCGGGPGASSFDKMSTIVQWVEQGKTPNRIVATKTDASAKVSKLLCPYPQSSKYKGIGSSDDAGNFSCVEKR
jgi:feruloyl esterase